MKKLCLASLCALALVAACSRPVAQEEPVRAVRVVTVGVQAPDARFEYAAEVRPRVESRLGFRVGGKIIRRQVEVGQRVKAALAQAKIRGVKLGTTINQINGKGRDAQRTAAQERAEQLGGIITPMRESGATLRQIAATLTAQGIKTPRSGNWSAATVRAVLVRL